MKYKLEMASELCACFDRSFEAENDEDAIKKAEEETEYVPVLICATLYREGGNKVIHWGA